MWQVRGRPAPERSGGDGMTSLILQRVRTPRWVGWALVLVGALVALWLPNGLYPAVAVDMLCWALFAVAIDLLLGYGGLLSFGHAAFWGTSAYTAGIIAARAGVPFPVAVLGGALAAAALAVPIGYLA